MDLWDVQWRGHALLAWLLALGAGVVGYAIVHGALAVLGARLHRLARASPGGALQMLAAVVRATRGWVLLLLSVVVALRVWAPEPALQRPLEQLTHVLVGLQVALWLNRLVAVLLGRAVERDAVRNPVMIGVIKWSAQLAIWVMLLLAVLANAGVNVNAFIASLGVGGVAVALAAQNVLGDLFASISIGLDKPFEVGDYIGFGSESGTVVRVGIKSTRIQSLSGEELAIANAQLLQQTVHNYSRMTERRIAFELRLAIDPSRPRIEHFVHSVPPLLRAIDKVRFDRFHLTGFGDGWMAFECVYYVLAPSYAVFRDVQQQIHFDLLDLLAEKELQLAVPVRALQGPAPAAPVAAS